MVLKKGDDAIVDYCKAQGIAFLPWFPQNTGNLAKPDSPLSGIAEKYGVTPAQIALAWLLKRSDNILPIPGTSSTEHLEDNISAGNVQLSDEDFKRLSDLEK